MPVNTHLCIVASDSPLCALLLLQAKLKTERLGVGAGWAIVGSGTALVGSVRKKEGWREGRILYLDAVGGVAEARGEVKVRYWHTAGMENDAKLALDDKTQWTT